MKGVTEEKKLKSPLFPRLHINDTEKGGPRAPPRNKMALYEQLSIPSQRFTSGSASMSPFPPNNISNLVPSTSSTQGGGHTKTLFSPFISSPASHHLPERPNSCSSSGMNVNTTPTNLERRPMKHTGHFSTNANFSLFQPQSFSNSKNSSVKNLGDEDNFGIPIFSQLGRTPSGRNREQKNVDIDKVSTSSSKSSRLLQTSREKHLNQTSTTEPKSWRRLGNQTKENPNLCQSSKDRVEKPASILSNGDRNSESVKRAHVSLNQEKTSSLVDSLHSLHDLNEQSHQESRGLQENKVLKGGASMKPEKATGKRNNSISEGASDSRRSHRDNHRNPYMCEIVSECREDQECGSLQVGDADKNDDDSETSMVESVSGANVSPDDVVGVIGQKQFWKARRAIVHQQRVFAVQVFELHRLIKVQRLIAGSPNILLEKNNYLGKPSMKVSPLKNLTPEFVLEPLPLTVKPREDIDTSKGQASQQTTYKPYTANPPTASPATDKSPPWYFHPPPGNQWLVPVMSPSEGLIYKPYDPTSGFTAPFYGSCGPTSVNPLGGDLLATAYGVPPSHHQGIGIFPGTPPMGPTYFPPYGMPVMNPSFSSSAAEVRSNGHDNQVSVGGVNFTVPYKNSCNALSEKSVRNVQESRESDFQGSTASSPAKVQSNALPLFPTVPTAQASDEPGGTHSCEHRTQVIKVVPHNPRSAPESAARIFQSIQEERKQYDEVVSHMLSGS